ncbi:UNKNOWN [Stylonychia lemnae]|uniref:Morn repeat protein n=1 Tax=Stylonychia lemnae TaxID=5949 RepID=A0A078A2H7_STYLE|nr:UNKNOWN [Stylonychia lemnae]|eukprot:CDW76406.1 UNKNOWN [Stylonychia lemnae]
MLDISGDLYEGVWKDNKLNEYGRYIFGSGKYFIGEYKDGQQSGYGKYYQDDGCSYEGQLTNDSYEGLGLFKWYDGDQYYGQWVNNERQGLGVYTYNNGDIDFGQWFLSDKHGIRIPIIKCHCKCLIEVLSIKLREKSVTSNQLSLKYKILRNLYYPYLAIKLTCYKSMIQKFGGIRQMIEIKKNKDQLHKIAQDPFNIEDNITLDCFVCFNYRLFLKVLVYHIAFFYLIGPFMILIFFLIEGKTFTYNMGFYGYTKTHFNQAIHAICFLTSVLLFYFQGEKCRLNPIEVFMSSISTLIFCLIIALRYGSSPEIRIIQQYQRRFTEEDDQMEFMVKSWKKLNMKTIDTHIKCSMVRNDIENLTFQVMFLSKISDDFHKRLSNYRYYEENPNELKTVRDSYKKLMKSFEIKRQNVLINQSKLEMKVNLDQINNNLHYYSTKKSIGEDENQQIDIILANQDELSRKYPARLFLKELLLSTEILQKQRPSIVFKVFSIVHSLLPFILTFNSDFNSRESDKNWYRRYQQWQFWVFFITNFYINSFIYYHQSMFLEISLIDFRRRYYLMNQIQNLIEPNRMRLKSYEKIYPLINIFDKQSLMSWLDIRILALDIGY